MSVVVNSFYNNFNNTIILGPLFLLSWVYIDKQSATEYLYLVISNKGQVGKQREKTSQASQIGSEAL